MKLVDRDGITWSMESTWLTKPYIWQPQTVSLLVLEIDYSTLPQRLIALSGGRQLCWIF